MHDDLPQPVDGTDLASQREQVGIPKDTLAKRIGISRPTLDRWELPGPTSAIRAARYQRAIRAWTDEQLAKLA